MFNHYKFLGPAAIQFQKSKFELQGVLNVLYVAAIFTHLVLKLYKKNIYGFHLKLIRLITEVIFVARQSSQRRIFAIVLK